MKKLFSLFLLMFAGATLVFAQDDCASNECDRQPVTSKWQLMVGDAAYTNHYHNLQEYEGALLGIQATHGRLFKRSDRLSWQLTLMYYGSQYTPGAPTSGLVNPAGTSHISTKFCEADYAVYYNWLLFNRLQVRLGGWFGVNAGLLTGDSHAINNAGSIHMQAQLYASLQLRYGWDFKKWGLDLYANAATPFMGIRTADGRYTGFAESIFSDKFKQTPYSHVVFSSFHNTQGVNWEAGIDFALKRISLSLSYGANNFWWSDYELQNYRKNRFLKVGISVNLVGMQRGKSGNRQF